MVVIRLEMVKIFEISTSSHLGYVQDCYKLHDRTLFLVLIFILAGCADRPVNSGFW